MKKVDERVVTMLDNVKGVGIVNLSFFEEICVSVCENEIENGDYDINLYLFRNSSLTDKYLAYGFMASRGCKLGHEKEMKFLHPGDYDIHYPVKDDLEDVIMSLYVSYRNKTSKRDVLNEIRDSCNWRILDTINVISMINYQTDTIVDYDLPHPLTTICGVIMSLDSYFNLADMNIEKIYTNILDIDKVCDEYTLDKICTIHNSIYDYIAMIAKDYILQWITPDEKVMSDIYEIPGSVLILAYANFIECVNIASGYDEETKDALLDGDLENISDEYINKAFSIMHSMISPSIAEEYNRLMEKHMIKFRKSIYVTSNK